MKLARESLRLTRKAFTEKYGGTTRSLENNEAGANEAGITLLEAFTRAGISADWLLTGEGPMLLADLKAQIEETIDTETLATFIGIAIKKMKKGTPEQIAAVAAEFYVKMLSEGAIARPGSGTVKKGEVA